MNIRLVIDTNKIMAALIRDSIIRRILFHPKISYYTPEYALNEIDKHKNDILEKTPHSLYDIVFRELRRIIKIVDVKEMIPYHHEAKNIASNFDIDDWPFIALALKLKLPIWTNDKDMIRYGIESCKYLAIDTETLLKALRKEVSLNNWKIVKEELKKKYGFN